MPSDLAFGCPPSRNWRIAHTTVKLKGDRNHPMTRRYYATRKQPGNLTLDDLYMKFQNLYLLFRERDYFKEKAGITDRDLPDAMRYEAAIVLTFQPFPITKWSADEITQDHVFETLEFLHDHVSKPHDWGPMTNESGFNYSDYRDYDEEVGREEFRTRANVFLPDYGPGYELAKDGTVVALGTDGLQFILKADIEPYDELNVDCKVRNAISKWRNRHASLDDKKEAIRELADVFEWLKKTKGLSTVMDSKDESAIFDLANNFAIRHHNPKQKSNYDRAIWFSWIFHFYLATYHAAIRLLIKRDKTQRRSRQ